MRTTRTLPPPDRVRSKKLIVRDFVDEIVDESSTGALSNGLVTMKNLLPSQRFRAPIVAATRSRRSRA
jgi:hypothetical protein